jgi:hypothetical protein
MAQFYERCEKLEFRENRVFGSKSPENPKSPKIKNRVSLNDSVTV